MSAGIIGAEKRERRRCLASTVWRESVLGAARVRVMHPAGRLLGGDDTGHG